MEKPAIRRPSELDYPAPPWSDRTQRVVHHKMRLSHTSLRKIDNSLMYALSAVQHGDCIQAAAWIRTAMTSARYVRMTLESKDSSTGKVKDD